MCMMLLYDLDSWLDRPTYLVTHSSVYWNNMSCCLWYWLHIGWWLIWYLIYGMGAVSCSLFSTNSGMYSLIFFHVPTLCLFAILGALRGMAGCLCSQYQTDYFYHPCRNSAGIATLFRWKILLITWPIVASPAAVCSFLYSFTTTEII